MAKKYPIPQSYVYFNVVDSTGSPVLSTYTLEQTPLTFIPDFASSDLLASARLISSKVIKWSFGDGTYSNDLTATHSYKWPGIYNVVLTVFDKYGKAYDSRYKPTITVRDFIADELVWGEYGKYIYDVPASKIGDPLKIYTRNSWQSYAVLSATGITINLATSGAGGDFIGSKDFFKDKWAHLRTLSKFYEKKFVNGIEQFVVVDTLTAKTTEIYARYKDKKLQICNKADENSFFVGTTGVNEVYYVDDKVKNYTSREHPIFLVATFDGAKFKDEFSQRRHIFNYIDYPPQSFQNLKPVFFPLAKTRFNPAAYISISTTGIDGEGALSSTNFNIPEISWQNTEIPFVFKFKDSEGYTTKSYGPLSSSIVHPELKGLSGYDIQFGVTTVRNGVTVPLTGVSYYEEFTPAVPQSLGGFYKGYFVASEPATNCTLTAEVVVVDEANFPKDSLIGWISIPQYDYALRLFKQLNYDSCAGSVTLTLTSINMFAPTSKRREIFSLCVAPSGAGFGNDYQAWFTDVATDTIVKTDTYGRILSTIALSAAVTQVNRILTEVDYRSTVMPGVCAEFGASPSNIALDGNSDVWVSLYDSAKTIKIDNRNGYVTAVALPPTANEFLTLSSYGSLPELSGFAGEGVLLPGSVDADLDNNVWVSYTHALSNFVVKYDTYGNVLKIIPFPAFISPIEICADRNSTVWITTFNHNVSGYTLSGRDDYLYRFNYDGELLPGFPITGFRTLNNITIDAKQNAWVSHDRSTLTKIDSRTNERTDYQAGLSSNETTYICGIVGIACDTADYIWVVNDYDKKIYIIDGQLPPAEDFTYIDSVDLQFPVPSPQYPVSAYELNQFQAYGDWFGQRWINKYMQPVSVVRTLTGVSNKFDINPSSGLHGLSKINENWNAKEFYKSLRYQEVLLDKTILFDDFLGSILGGDGQPYELGKTVYEKIANFVDNKADISTCNLDSLISFCNELSVQYEQYNYPFPPQLRRLIDILSIKHCTLWGSPNTYNENFDSRGTYVKNATYGINLGTEISPVSGVISSGEPIVAFEKFSDIYSIVNFSGIPGMELGTVVPLSTYSNDWGWGIVAPPSISGVDVANYYRFYTFLPNESPEILGSIIDWANPHTTLTPYNSSYGDWTRTNGVMQNLLSYELTKGLRLFTSAADITFNN